VNLFSIFAQPESFSLISLDNPLVPHAS